MNDTGGHDAGDLVLVEIARRLQACVRAHDLVARLGGDEFVVLLTELPAARDVAAAEAAQIAARIVSVIEHPCRTGGLAFHTTASVGVSLFGSDDGPREAALRRADMAMYRVKAEGRNGFRLFDPAMEHGVRERLATAAELRDALAAGDLLFHLQPQVDARRRVFGAEALLRWRRPGGSLRQPRRVPVGRRGERTDRADRRLDAGRGATGARRVAGRSGARPAAAIGQRGGAAAA